MLRERGHIAIELFVEHLPRPVRALANRTANVAGLLICLILLGFASRQWWRSFASGNQVYETFVYAEWYQYALPPPIFLLLTLLFWRQLRQSHSTAERERQH